MSSKTKGVAHLNLETLSGALVAKNHPVLIIDTITSLPPRTVIYPEVKFKARDFLLADPTFDKGGPFQLKYLNS